MTAELFVSGGAAAHDIRSHDMRLRSSSMRSTTRVASSEAFNLRRTDVHPEAGRHGRAITLRRLAVVVCAAVLAWSGWNIVMPQRAQSATGAVEVVTYTVRPGDTLWSYASDVTPRGGDVSDTVYELKTLNHLDSTSLQPGQTLLVPAQ